ncbi:MAG: hypothetical protein KAY24_11330 [Candidatus Eisenbacteria sp.]|nr:hypothetical protein [Candidatus Eisenbacteria bacterium]
MTDVRPSREKGHLAVAAIRVIRHQQKRPPSPDEIGDLLGWTGEETRVVLGGLVDVGILHMQKTPFEVHYDISDHLKLEELVVEADKAALQEEVDSFKQRSKSKQKKMEQLLKSGGIDERKSRQMKALEEQFADFKKTPPQPPI